VLKAIDSIRQFHFYTSGRHLVGWCAAFISERTTFESFSFVANGWLHYFNELFNYLLDVLIVRPVNYSENRNWADGRTTTGFLCALQEKSGCQPELLINHF